ncbi:MAG TPA: hypothetical protein VNW54_03245 [Granulicella sp.]|jgi:hypothetical protein|nr:hypothetical protein [Granulicella sp.]
MDTKKIIEIIRKRRAHAFDRPLADPAADLPVYSEAGVARVISDEYGALLEEIEGFPNKRFETRSARDSG